MPGPDHPTPDPADRASAAATRLVQAALDRGMRLVTAESLTGGLASYLLVSVPGSGDVVAGAVVAYQSDEKRRVLSVGLCPVVSAECAGQMALGAARLFRVDGAVAFTGVAGPATQEGRPVGTVFVATLLQGRASVVEHHFDGDPDAIRMAAIAEGFDRLADRLEQRAG